MAPNFYHHCSWCGRSCSCVIAGTVFITTTYADPWYIQSIDQITRTTTVFASQARAVNDPWYGDFRIIPNEMRLATAKLAQRPWRAQARTCKRDVRRWKRRRFIQALRRSM